MPSLPGETWRSQVELVWAGVFVVLVATSTARSGAQEQENGASAVTSGSPVEAVFFDRVTLADEFWLSRLRTQREVLVPYSLRQTEKALDDLKAMAKAHDVTTQSAQLTLVPYYAWNNRGVGAMQVWFPDNMATLRDGAIVISDNARRFKSARATYTFNQDREAAMVDGRLPKNSFDQSIPRGTSWPQRGRMQSVELELAKSTMVRSVEVYWYDDRGGVQVPKRWSLEVWQNGRWQPFPLYSTDTYGIARDQFNVVHPAEPLTTERLRLRAWPQLDAAVGILEVVVEPER
jgi:hypothetical protein